MPRSGTIAIVGRPNVGKSTLLNALLGEPIAIVSRHPQTTRDQIRGVLTRGATQFVFVDTPGVHAPRHKLGSRMNALAREAARAADVVVLLTDALSGPRDDDLALVADLPAKVPVVLVLNKVDRVKAKAELLPVLEAYGKARDFVAIVPVSALRGEGIERVLDEIQKKLQKGPKLFGDEELSDRPVRFFVAEFVREQILRNTRQEVPHGVAVVVERFDETPTVPHIELAIHVDRAAHKKIIVGAGGAMLKRIGTDARARVERMMGKHVHLKLWVRVTPGWYENEARLRDLGYGDT